jgi:hypothetical protein
LFQFDLKRIRNRQETTLLAVDVAMLVLLVVNLSWLIFDSLFAAHWFSGLVEQLSPAFHDWYATAIAPNFWRYDLVFVTIFLTEFAARWVIAIRRETYLRWYFYPFLHWYELLGCIPLMGFRALRFLRIFSMTVRLNRLGVINLRETAVGRFARTYYDIFSEEISDRVVLSVLDRVQAELGSGQPLTHRIVDEVVLERRHELVEQISLQVDDILRHNYDFNKEAIHRYIGGRIRSAVAESEDVSRLGRIPVFGGRATDMLERSVTDIVRNLVETTVADLRSADNRQVIEKIVRAVIDVLVDHDDRFHATSNDMLIDAIEIVKERVRIQRWRERMEADPRMRPQRGEKAPRDHRARRVYAEAAAGTEPGEKIGRTL